MTSKLESFVILLTNKITQKKSPCNLSFLEQSKEEVVQAIK